MAFAIGCQQPSSYCNRIARIRSSQFKSGRFVRIFCTSARSKRSRSFCGMANQRIEAFHNSPTAQEPRRRFTGRREYVPLPTLLQSCAVKDINPAEPMRDKSFHVETRLNPQVA